MTSVGFPELSTENSEIRTPVVLLLDSSGSMQGEPIQELNRGLEVFKEELLQDLQAKLSAEVTIITFGGVVKQIHDFVSADQFQPPQLQAAGPTPMGQAIELALNTLEDRKKVYKENAIDYYRPWIVLITDGAPTDEWQNAAERVHNAEKAAKAVFFAVAVQGANIEILKQIAPEERPPALLNQLKFIELFEWLGNSVKRVSNSKKGDELDLPSPDSWRKIKSL